MKNIPPFFVDLKMEIVIQHLSKAMHETIAGKQKKLNFANEYH